jgi:hypothetical protein
MNTTKRNSGNWGVQQDKKLGDLLRTNQVDCRNKNGDYLFEVTEKYFPAFISAGKGGKNSAVQRLRGKFIRFEQDLLQQGARSKCFVIVGFSLT